MKIVLTIDVEGDPFADNWRNVVGCNTQINGHHLAGNSIQSQFLSSFIVHFCFCKKRTGSEVVIVKNGLELSNIPWTLSSLLETGKCKLSEFKITLVVFHLWLLVINFCPSSRRQTILGPGFPVALHVSVTLSPSLTETSLFSSSTILGGTWTWMQPSCFFITIVLICFVISKSSKYSSATIYARAKYFSFCLTLAQQPHEF